MSLCFGSICDPVTAMPGTCSSGTLYCLSDTSGTQTSVRSQTPDKEHADYRTCKTVQSSSSREEYPIELNEKPTVQDNKHDYLDIEPTLDEAFVIGFPLEASRNKILESCSESINFLLYWINHHEKADYVFPLERGLDLSCVNFSQASLIFRAKLGGVVDDFRVFRR